ncbi:MAG TPA: FAD-dependent monooxygenase, partial [Nannocystaceae bacterium]|nr:FAD-dependent monooxygenase [Nannocystaceae bacterium]
MHDVVIVGAGPAGSALATRLSAAGADVVVLDQAHFPRDKVCGDFVNARALAQLQALGCYDDIVALGCTPITRSSTWLGDRCLARTDLPHIAGMPAHGFTIPRKQLDAAILARAQRAGAGVVEGARAIELAYERDHVTVVAEHEGS